MKKIRKQSRDLDIIKKISDAKTPLSFENSYYLVFRILKTFTSYTDYM